MHRGGRADLPGQDRQDAVRSSARGVGRNTEGRLGLGFVDRERSAADLLERGVERVRDLRPFRLAFPRLNCFHEAVVAEVESDGVIDAGARLRDGAAGPFLPHLSLAYTWAPGPPEPLRDALVPIREMHLGEQEVREIELCVVPASRTTIFEPWTVAGRAALAGD